MQDSPGSSLWLINSPDEQPISQNELFQLPFASKARHSTKGSFQTLQQAFLKFEGERSNLQIRSSQTTPYATYEPYLFYHVV